jgi:hypothetical protein
MKTLRRLALPAALLLGLAVSVHAQEAPQAAATAAPFFRASVASFDAITQLVTDLGLPVTNYQATLESQVPFLGPGSVAGDRPFGVVLLASDDTRNLQQNAVFVIPTVPGKVTAEALTQAGAKPVDGQPGSYALEVLNLRQAANDLIVQIGATQGLALVGESAFAADYRQPGNVAVVAVDLAAARTAAPTAYNAIISQIETNSASRAADPAARAGEDFGAAAVLTFIKRLEKVSVALGRDATALHLKTWLAPFTAKAVTPAPRPNFPQGVLFQAHVVYPDADWAHWADRLIDGLPAEALDHTTPAQAARGKALVKRAANLFLEGDAVSCAAAVRDGKPIVYLVVQRADAVDAAAELRAMTAEFTGINKDLGASGAEEAAVTSYDAGGKSVTRLTVKSKDAMIYADALQDGKTLYATFSPADGKHVAELAGLGMNGTTASLCAGALDLGAVVQAGSDGNGPFASLPPNTLRDLRAAVAGQALTWAVQAGGQGNFLYADVQIPMPLAKQLARLVGQSAGLTPAPEPQTP